MVLLTEALVWIPLVILGSLSNVNELAHALIQEGYNVPLTGSTYLCLPHAADALHSSLPKDVILDINDTVWNFVSDPLHIKSLNFPV